MPDADSGDDFPPFELVVSASDGSDQETTGASMTMRLAISESDEGCILELRSVFRLNDPRVIALYDAEVKVVLSNDEALTDDDFAEFVGGWGAEYVFGFIRGAVADGATKLGQAPIMLPPHVLTQLSDEDVAEIVQEARQRQADAAVENPA